MLSTSIPYKFLEIFGKNASSALLTAPIPQTTGSGIRASQDLGFPLATATPIGAGGVPPDIRDFNGVLQYETSWSQWFQAGGVVPYDSTFQTAIGGYPKNALVASGSTSGLIWRSTAENNITNPDSGGAGWISATAGRLLGSQIFTTSGTYTPTTGMGFAIIEVQGGGGGGAGCTGAAAGNVSLGAPGTSGTYAKGLFTATAIGSSQVVTIGSGSNGGVGIAATTGGTSSVGALIAAPGGVGGGTLTNQVPPTLNGNGGTSSAATGGNIVSSVGGISSVGFCLTASIAYCGNGGASVFGNGAIGVSINTGGSNASNPGSGGGGTAVNSGGGTATGGKGAAGIVIVWEYSV